MDIEDGPFHDKTKIRRTAARYNNGNDGRAGASNKDARGKGKGDDDFVRNLTIATGAAAVCFLISSVIIFARRKKP